LYGFLPQTYCGDLIGKHCAEKVGKDKIKGDGDPIDICVLTEKNIFHGNILARAIPIGGFRMIDKDDADDKIIAVLQGDATYGNFKDISELPTLIVDRLRHYFLTYKDMPGESRNAEITHIYGYQEAREIIIHAMNDYKNKFDRLNDIIDVV
jgi:inorganic pyrophosphatase